MRIDIIISSLKRGGAERVCVVLAEGLSKAGFDVKVIVLNSVKNGYKLSEDIKFTKLKNSIFIKNRLLEITYNLFKHYRMNSNRPDIIISFMAPIAYATIPVAKLFNLKIIISEHSNHRRHDSFISRYVLINLLYKIADRLVVLTSTDLNYYKKLGINTIKIYNPSPIKFSKIKHKKEKIIVAAGSLDRYKSKGLDRLIVMAKTLLSDNSWQLLIAGEGKGHHKLQKLINDNKLNSRVVLLGSIQDMEGLLSRASIFVLNSKYEGLPMVLIEAIAMKVPCVSYNCFTGPSEIIIDKINGVLVEDQNETEFISSVHELIHDDELRKKYSENTFDSYMRFEKEKIINEWVYLIHSIIKD